MQKVINVDDLVVTIKYRKNMKNIYLKVEKNADVVVSAPPRTPNYLIKKLIRDNIDEIKLRRNNILMNGYTVKQYVTGEKHIIFGKEFVLEVKLGNKNVVRLSDDKIILVIKDKDQDREQIVTSYLRKVLYNKALEFINKYEKIMGVHAEQLRIKKMKTRWGTCNIEAKRIWVNYELIKYPIECLEHIVVHELTHLLETNHTPRFYALLGKYYPNFRENDKLIKEFSKKIVGR
ncbi:MAG: SprT family zinc-dependent metalloprotease [Gemella haemolysans]|uniref:M48 family metallopeptidase n=1 Tax=Gemella haemolysans TaxID=1379 RepID=UPI00290F9F0C|nr:SprT family zinc-dependent metalloprotease [Gemella haemolysans]MDU4713585.1 SprT family zinc-dependent metalloprotease [Gemella haemolysans]